MSALAARPTACGTRRRGSRRRLVRDMAGVLTSFCARLYDRRPARNRALKAAGCAQRDIGAQAVLAAETVGGVGKDSR